MTALATELNEFDAHCKQVASQMARGSVVPLLGAGANLCGRVEPWTPGHTGLPSGAELAAHLADFFSFPERSRDLVRITQYVATTLGDQPLYDELHVLFAATYGPTALHQFLARIPGQIQTLPEAPLKPHPLVVTTNYDDALEQAYREEDRSSTSSRTSPTATTAGASCTTGRTPRGAARHREAERVPRAAPQPPRDPEDPRCDRS